MPGPDPAAAFDRHAHDHGACVAAALAAAERRCTRAGARLTETRRRVLELIWAEGQPLGAYDLIERLSAERGRVAPPTVYRALEFLLAHGLVHRIESRNAYFGCTRPEAADCGPVLICRRCGAVAEPETAGIDAALAAEAERLGFRLEGRTVEVSGLCPVCARPAGQADG